MSVMSKLKLLMIQKPKLKNVPSELGKNVAQKWHFALNVFGIYLQRPKPGPHKKEIQRQLSAIFSISDTLKREAKIMANLFSWLYLAVAQEDQKIV